ncbi:MAG TPA: sialate O-acetylesterase [Pirellulales bacterium]|nr:sialate O-acetylesterase [Pirellulales bacterium]
MPQCVSLALGTVPILRSKMGLSPSRAIAWTLLVVVAAAQARPASAEITPSNLFSDNAVLQRDVRLPVWGTTNSGDQVTVSFAGQEVSTTPADGKWQVELSPLKASGDPATLTITQGDQKVERKNLLVGDVWVCGGQSNMQWEVHQVAGAPEAIAASANDKLRLYTVPRKGAPEPQAGVDGNWSVAGPETVPHFTAVGYFFGRDLQASLGVPVGLINSNIGGTTAERWLSKEALDANESLKGISAPQGRNDLWNAMIFPLIKFPIKGAIWYQGESNAGRAWQYRALLPTMIKAWRDAWKVGDFPFLIVQLAPFEGGQPITKEPVESDWAELREAQSLTAQSLPNVGLAVITDLGDPKDIHPPRKREVGERLALAAKAMVFAQNIPYSGPVYDKQSIDGDKIVLHFKHVGSGLEARDGDLQGFTIAGEDKKFFTASAKIEGETVVVSSDKVPHPVAVRYGWANYPVGNLWNKDGLPTSPFRTDDFPAITKDKQ